jgi:hypothetical protein
MQTHITLAIAEQHLFVAQSGLVAVLVVLAAALVVGAVAGARRGR